MPKCKICGYEALDIGKHVRLEHNIHPSKYKKRYGMIVDPSVLEKRKATCKDRYGTEHYTNRAAAALSNMTFEGGHSLRDPKVKEKIRSTKQKRYGDSTFTNRDKSRKTCFEKYGVEHSCAAPSVIKKRLKTLKKRYGKVFNIVEPPNKKKPPENFVEMFNAGISISEISQECGVSYPVVTRWVKEFGLKRKPIRSNTTAVSLEEVISLYFSKCLEKGRCLSFYEFSLLTETRFFTMLKRWFNKNMPYNCLKQNLFDSALDSEKQKFFLKMLKE